VIYDPAKISYHQLLQSSSRGPDPTQLIARAHDGPQYRSALVYRSPYPITHRERHSSRSWPRRSVSPAHRTEIVPSGLHLAEIIIILHGSSKPTSWYIVL